MTNKETIERNIGLTFDLVNQIIDSPANLDNLPDNGSIQFVEKDFPALKSKNIKYRRKSKSKKVHVRNTFQLST